MDLTGIRSLCWLGGSFLETLKENPPSFSFQLLEPARIPWLWALLFKAGEGCLSLFSFLHTNTNSSVSSLHIWRNFVIRLARIIQDNLLILKSAD